MRLNSIHTYPVKGCHRLDHDGARVEPWGLAGDRRWMLVDADGVGVTQREVPALATLRPAVRAGGLVLRAAGLPDFDLAEPEAGDPVEVRVFSFKAPVPARAAGAAADDWLGEALDRSVHCGMWAPDRLRRSNIHNVRLFWLADPTVRSINPSYSEPGDRVSFADGHPLLVTNAASLDVVNGWLLESGSVEAPLPMTRFRPNLVVSGGQPWAEDGWLGRRIRVGEVVFRAVKPCDRCVVTTVDQETGEKGSEPLRILARHRNFDQGLLFGMKLIPDSIGRVAIDDPIELLR